MVSQANTSNELYNLRWNSYYTNLINVFTEHQNQESLVDVTLGCEGQFIKAHKLVLSACSLYFHKIFQSHTSPQLLILLNDVKFDSLRLVVQFMYKGEVKVADSELQKFLQVGKMLQVKGLCSVELQEKQKSQANGEATNKEVEAAPEKKTNEVAKPETKPEQRKTYSGKNASSEPKKVEKDEPPPVKKRKLPSPSPETKKKATNSASSSPVEKDISRIPRPPNAFMIFANQWRKKLAVEYPNESNKDISVRLGNMWKSLSPETKDAFYEDAKKADEEHKLKYPGYYYSPKEARHRKAIASITKAAKKLDSPNENGDSDDSEYIEIKCEGDSMDTSDHSTPQSNGAD